MNNPSQTEQPGSLKELLVLKEPPQGLGSVEEEFSLGSERKEGREFWKRRKGGFEVSSILPPFATPVTVLDDSP